MSAARAEGPYVRRHGWWVGGAVGAVVAVAAGLGAHSYQERGQEAALAGLDTSLVGESDVPPPVDTVRDLLALTGPVVVHPELVDDVDPARLRRASEVLERTGESPVRRVAYVPHPDGLNAGYTNSGALVQWMESLGEEGHYVMVFEGGATQVGAIGLEEEFLSTDGTGQPGAALLRVATEVAQWPTEPAEEDDPQARWLEPDEEFGGLWGGMAAGGLISLVTVVPIFAAVRFLAGRRRTKEG